MSQDRRHNFYGHERQQWKVTFRRATLKITKKNKKVNNKKKPITENRSQRCVKDRSSLSIPLGGRPPPCGREEGTTEQRNRLCASSVLNMRLNPSLMFGKLTVFFQGRDHTRKEQRVRRSKLYKGRPTSKGGYDTRLVIEWARVRILNKAWMYLREKKSDFRLKWIPVSNGKQRTSSVLCWDHRL
ncbi:hypothetical protein TNCV_2097451 [Trichonephila clavipes]|nr:hypothetical protein TNCV_2097451 [Trichonephila clavipes]